MLKNPFTNNSILNKYKNLINHINNFESELKTLTDSELRAKSFKLKKQYEVTKNLNSLIAESFALTREASNRTLGLRHFDVQLLGGLVLNDQEIAEMKSQNETLNVKISSLEQGIIYNATYNITYL